MELLKQRSSANQTSVYKQELNVNVVTNDLKAEDLINKI